MLGLPHDESRGSSAEQDRKFLRSLTLDGEWHRVITFAEHVLRIDACPDELQRALHKAFDDSPIAYFVKEVDGMATVMPRISRETGEATRQAIGTLEASGMSGAGAHLRDAAEHMNAGQYADSIADSIGAIESVACNIDPGANRSLGPALDSLENAGILRHGALKEAFKKLYGYASDEPGVRHALVFESKADVGLDEAIFMFGACASFAAYLAQKHREAEDDGEAET